MRWSTDIASAFRITRKFLFKPIAGDRKRVRNVVVLISDGEADSRFCKYIIMTLKITNFRPFNGAFKNTKDILPFSSKILDIVEVI